MDLFFREVVEADYVSSDSDSGQTWPPASVRKKKTSSVRMYDHSARKCSEYVQQCGVVRMETPEEVVGHILYNNIEQQLNPSDSINQLNPRIQFYSRKIRVLDA